MAVKMEREICYYFLYHAKTAAQHYTDTQENEKYDTYSAYNKLI